MAMPFSEWQQRTGLSSADEAWLARIGAIPLVETNNRQTLA